MERENAKTGILIAFGELYLKSKPVRTIFIKKLVYSLKFYLEKEKVNCKIHYLRDRLIIETQEMEKAKEIVKNIFGISWFAEVTLLKSCDLEKIVNFIKLNQNDLIKKENTFALRLRYNKEVIKERRDEIIDKVAEAIDRKVNLTNPQTELFLEIRKGGCYIYSKKEKGAGGLPLESSAKSLIMMSGGIDSPVAAYFAAKRGSHSIWIHFHSFPYSSKASIEKVEELAKIFKNFQPKIKVIFVPFGACQMKIRAGAPANHRVILYRRLMLKVAEQVAKKAKCFAIFTGESLGQVSSQTLPNMEIVEEAIKMPILRPLIGFDKEEITKISKEIGMLEVSIKPHEDCCTLFVSKHQSAESKLKNILEIEKDLPIEEMIKECLDGIEIKEF